MANPGGDLALAGMRFDLEQAGIEMIAVALQGEACKRRETGAEPMD